MTSLHLIKSQEPQTECLICRKTLGAESREQGYLLCHEHRKCIQCTEDLTAREVRLCYDRYVEILEKDEQPNYTLIDVICPHCSVLSRNHLDKDPTLSIRQSEYDYLNLIRLSVIPDTDLNQVTNENNAMIYSTRLVQNMNFEQKSLHMSKLQACLAQVQIAIRKDPEFKKGYLEDREKQKFAKANREALTSSRPVSKSAESPEEIQLGTFMELHELTDRKIALKVMQDMNKGIKSFMTSLKVSEPLAREMSLKILKDTGRIKK